MANIQYKFFSEIDLKDSFFDSLRQDYQGFDNWYNKKALQGEKAYILYEENKLVCFLYLKEENPIDNTGIIPPLDSAKSWIKVGTFKVIPHRTKLGERLIKRMFDFAISRNIFNLYLTIFSKHKALINLLEQYGFKQWGNKGDELVLIKNIATTSKEIQQDICLDFPSINTKNVSKYILGIYPQYHTRMFSDSMLKNENFSILQDSSYNISFKKRVILDTLRGIVKRESEPYWGFVSLNDDEFQQILKAGEVNESIIIH